MTVMETGFNIKEPAILCKLGWNQIKSSYSNLGIYSFIYLCVGIFVFKAKFIRVVLTLLDLYLSWTLLCRLSRGMHEEQ